ncbi:MAG: sialidase family protein [Verrucomicrobia bacterium]|nr:sialidase family protein [Verrucomicrobiota bacterium]
MKSFSVWVFYHQISRFCGWIVLPLFLAFGLAAQPVADSAVPGYTIPIVDISNETHRQVIVDREPEQYLGHPTTVLLEDQKTMLVVYPKGHGRGAIVYKRSSDAGLTWSDRLPVPENWSTSLEVPTLYRVTDQDEHRRLILFSGLYPVRMASSEDDGANWSPLKPIGDFGGIVAMSDLVPLKEGATMALFHDDGRFIRKDSKPARPPVFLVYKTISRDGCRTWSQPEVIARHATAHLCEPGAIRSPDGKQIAVLLRENSRKLNSFVIFSDDEGRTWSEPRELPAALTGDRHQAQYAPDGRLFVTFRDTTLVSPTKGDWVGWVGTYEDIVRGRQGQYRVRLMDNHKNADCAYPGLELLPDGTFVATTYGHWIQDEQPFIVSVRFKLEELDSKLAKEIEQTTVFSAGTDGYHTFRIPSVILARNGAVIALGEGRKRSASDTGDIDVVMKRSLDGGRTWGGLEIVWDDDGNTCGNPCPVLDAQSGTIWLLLTHNLGEDREGAIVQGKSRGTRTVWVCKSTDDGASWSKPVEITSRVKRDNWTWYATGPGVGIQMRSGRLVVPCDNKEAGTDKHQSHVIYSDDHGATWNLGSSVGPDCNECQVAELSDGRLLLNMRSYRRNNQRLIAFSKDGGESWSEPREDETLIEPVCQASLLRYPGTGGEAAPRLLFSNPASKRRENMTVRLSSDEGRTWWAARTIHGGPAAYSCLIVLPDGTIGCLYERGEKSPYEGIAFARFSFDWLANGEL